MGGGRGHWEGIMDDGQRQDICDTLETHTHTHGGRGGGRATRKVKHRSGVRGDNGRWAGAGGGIALRE